MTERIAILGGVRTPFCKSGGALREIAADDLGAHVVRELIARLDMNPADFDEVVIGNVAQPTHAANISRVIAQKAGIPRQVPARTVHRNCASGMEAITTAATDIHAGRSSLVMVGGVESMSQIPLLYGKKMTGLFMKLAKARTAGARARVIASFRPSFLKPIVAIMEGLTDPICSLNMAETAEVLAREFGVSRSDQDAFALLSHQRASTAQTTDVFTTEIAPMIGPPRYDATHRRDDGPRAQQSLEALEKLRPICHRDAGTVTAGNACPITDGAVALVIASESKAKALGITPLGYLSDWSYAGLEGRRMGLGPAYATAALLDRTGLGLSDFDLVEMNEAFAAQVIANEKAFASDSFGRDELNRREALGEIDRDRLNVNGGAIALGHPVGATGARMVLTALHELHRRGDHRALATLCVSGGQGAALALEAA